jgi:hypothetical protein
MRKRRPVLALKLVIPFVRQMSEFLIPSRPPLHAKYPGGTHHTGGDLILNGVHFGLYLGNIGK